MLSINNNAPTMMVARMLRGTDTEIARATERLTTGRRINHASDDPAGLSMAVKMRSQISGLQVARNNALDAKGMADMADGALQSVTAVLREVRNLAVAYGNDTLSTDQKADLQAKADDLMGTITQIGTDTKYGDVALLSGASAKTFMVSADGSKTATVDTIDLATTMGASTFTLSSATAIDDIDEAIANVTGAQADFGSVSSRLDHTVDFLSYQEEITEGARTRIEDADMAMEAAKLSSQKIRQEAGLAMLAQASQQPSMILRLLGN